VVDSGRLGRLLDRFPSGAVLVVVSPGVERRGTFLVCLAFVLLTHVEAVEDRVQIKILVLLQRTRFFVAAVSTLLHRASSRLVTACSIRVLFCDSVQSVL